jgi:enamine deaminase RidA (YjgF/YER057c/UK114 family)
MKGDCHEQGAGRDASIPEYVLLDGVVRPALALEEHKMFASFRMGIAVLAAVAVASLTLASAQTARDGHSEKTMSKPSKEFLSPKALIPPGPAGYSHVAKVNRGTIVYISGQVPVDASGKLIGEGDFEAQVEQVFANLKIAVEAAGGTMADIVKLNYCLAPEVAQTEVPKLRPIRDRYINVEKPPASTFVVVSRLSRPGWLIEIEAVAALDD